MERIRAAAHLVVLGYRWINRTPSVRGADVATDRRCNASSQDHRDHDRRAHDIAIPLVQVIAAFDAMAVLPQCEVPVQTISSAVPTNDAASLLAANPTMTFGHTVGAGNFLQLEVPKQVNPMIGRFLAVIPGGTLAAP